MRRRYGAARAIASPGLTVLCGEADGPRSRRCSGRCASAGGRPGTVGGERWRALRGREPRRAQPELVPDGVCVRRRRRGRSLTVRRVAAQPRQFSLELLDERRVREPLLQEREALSVVGQAAFAGGARELFDAAGHGLRCRAGAAREPHAPTPCRPNYTRSAKCAKTCSPIPANCTEIVRHTGGTKPAGPRIVGLPIAHHSFGN
jgi:hypothetical protein